MSAPPSALTPLLGREESLARVGEWLEAGARLIAITGPAGVGKTQLAIQLARDAPLPTIFCDVAEAQDVAQVSLIVARSLGLAGDASGPEAIARALDARGPLLILLDNYEQVTPEADAWLAEWLRSSDAPRFLVTTRRRLQVVGDRTLELAPLPPPPRGAPHDVLRTNPAVVLFMQRAARAGITLDDELLPVVANIVRALDGLPLALELAAAKCRLLTVQEVAHRLSERASLLGDGPGQRHSLRAALDASWSLLTPAARQGLARAATFVGDWDLAAAQAVLGGGEAEVLTVLSELDEQSLLTVVRSRAGRRFRLYATVRSYAAERAVELAQTDEAVRRHAHHYAAWAQRQRVRLEGPEAASAIVEMARDLDNAVAAARALADQERAAALGLVVALAPVFEHQVPTDAYLELLELTLGPDEGRAIEEALGSNLRAQALIAKGRVLGALGRAAGAQGILQDALRTAERGGSALTIAEAAIAWGWNRGTRGDEAGADAAFARADEALAEASSPWLEAHLWRRRGYLAYRRGDREAAETDMRRAVERFQALGSRRDEASTLGWLGFVADGRPGRAVPYFERAVEMLEELGDARELARHLQYLAVFQLEEGALDASEASFERALSLQRRMADRQQEAVTRTRRCTLWLERGRVRPAVDELAVALRQLDGEGDLLYRGEALAIMAAAEVQLGLVEAAEGYIAQAREILVPLHYPALDALRLIEAQGDLAAGAPDAAARARGLAKDDGIDHSYALNRLAHRWLVRALGGDDPELRLDPAFAWFELGGERVSLARRAPMRRLLRALCEARDAGAEPVSAADLVAAGWPGENLVGSSGETRLYTTIRRMRKLGLADFLHHDGTGYRLTGRLVRP